jgi:ketosteroid isomerase-like protein
VADNVELVRSSFEAIRAWDIERLLALYDADVEFLPLTGTRVESGGYRGHSGVRSYLSEARDLWEVLEPEADHFENLGDCVVVAGTCRVRGKVSGAESTPACAWVIGVRDGLIASHRAFTTLEEAQKTAAAGARS